MKSLILLFAAILLITACDGPQNISKHEDSLKAKKQADSLKAQKIIKDYLDTTLAHPKTYVSISFTKLDSNFDSPDSRIHTDPNAPKIWYGFKMTHNYRVVDVLNSLQKEQETFFLDSNITKVIGIRDSIKSH